MSRMDRIFIVENQAYFALLRAGARLPFRVRAQACGQCGGNGWHHRWSDDSTVECRPCDGSGYRVPGLARMLRRLER
jgi:hypothetical protein